ARDGDRVEAAGRVEDDREYAVRARELLEREAVGREVEAAAAVRLGKAHAEVAVAAQDLDRRLGHLAPAVDLERERLELLGGELAQRGAHLGELRRDLEP